MTTMTISAADVNKLRQQTGAGMMDCKKALTEANGDFEAAIDILRKKGQKIAANRQDREAKEGYVYGKVSADQFVRPKSGTPAASSRSTSATPSCIAPATISGQRA